MGIEDTGVFRADRFRDPLLHLKNLSACLDERGLEAPNLTRNVLSLNVMPRNLFPILPDHISRSAGDAGGNPDALESDLLRGALVSHAATRVANVGAR